MSDLQRAIRKVVVASIHHTLPEYDVLEHEALTSALSTVHDPRSVSSTACTSCKTSLTNAELVGNLLVQEVEAAWNVQRKEMSVITRTVSRGQAAAVEVPYNYSSFRQLTVTREWGTYAVTGDVVYPPESYLSTSLLLSDKALNSSLALVEFNRGVASLLSATVFCEKEAFESNTGISQGKGKRSVRVVTVRKPLTSVTIDHYGFGRPDVGWYFESISGTVEFYHD